MTSQHQKLVLQRDKMVEDHIDLLKSFSDVKLSYWSFSTYKKCPQQFIMNCIGRDWRPRDDNFHAINGSVVHSVLEDFVAKNKTGSIEWKDRDFLTDNAPAYYDKFLKEPDEKEPTELANPVDWDHHQVSPDAHKSSSVPRIVENLDWAYNKLFQLGILPRDPAQIHQEFSFKTQLTSPKTGNLLPIKLTGRTDLVVDDTDGLIVLDYKDVIRKSNADWRQLVWYPLGLEPIFKKKVKLTGFLFTDLREFMPRKPDAINTRDKHLPKRTFREILFREILETARDVLQNKFDAKISRHHCHYCPVKRACPEFYLWKGQEEELMADLDALGEGEVSL